MPRMMVCPACHRPVPKRARFCGHCGAPATCDHDDRAGHRLLAFVDVARPRGGGPLGDRLAQHATRRGGSASANACAPEHASPACEATDDHPAASPGPDGGRDDSCDPRLWVVLLPLFVVIAMMVPAGLDPGTAIMNEVSGRAILVGVQYALLWSPFTQRTLALVVATQVVASIGQHQPSPDHPALFFANLLLTLAGLQAVGIAVWRAWRLASPQECPLASSDPPVVSGVVMSAARPTTSYTKGGRYAERQV
jgi:hypothetical protein